MSEKALILVVDDDEDWSDILTLSFRKQGYEAQAMPDTASAKAWLGAHKPSLILLDVMMPDGNGIDLCRWIRSQPGFERVPIIINSGIKDDETVDLALEMGAMDFLHKPVNLETLKQKIAKALAVGS